MREPDGTADIPSERRVVAVLFADIVGFTGLAERLDPETITDAVNEVFRVLGAEVEAVGGHVDKVIGDNLMALFGAPVAHEDDAHRAVRAALAMHRAVAARQADLQRALGGPVRLRIGIHAGQVVWGVVGPPGQTRPTVMGDAVNLASRLQRAAPEGGVLVSEAVWRQVRGAYDGHGGEPLVVRGRAEPVAVYEIVGPRARPEVMERPPFVDRTHDLAQIHDLLARARRGRAQVAVVTGEPGVGKTRLVEEFLASLPDEDLVLRTSCPPYGGQSLGPLSDLFRQFTGLLGPLTVADVEARLPLGERSAQAAAVLARLFNLAEVPGPDPVSHETALLVAAEAIRRMLVRPTVVWVEDLQWADAGTREVLPFIVERLLDCPLLVVGTIRAGEPPVAWGRRTPVSTLALEALADDDARALIAAILGARLPEATEAALVAKSGGNPFYLNEIIATLRGGGVLVLDDAGRWRVSGAVDAVLPDTIHAAVLARLDRLAPDLRLVTQRTAVIGMSFRQSLAAAICPEVDADDVLRRMEDAAIVQRRDPLAEDPEFGFVHPLLREVAYGSLLSKHQTRLHRQVADAMERLYADRRNDLAKTIAAHLERAGEDARALPYLVTAGEQAARRYATREAIELLERARAIAEATGRPEQAVAAAELLGELYLRVQGRGAEAWLDVWTFVRQHTDPASEPARRARAAIRVAHALVHENRLDDARAALDEARALLPAGHPVWSDLHRVAALGAVMQSRYEEALAEAREAVRIATEAGDLADRSRAYAVLAHAAILPLLGDEGRALMERWAAEAAAAGDERLLIEARRSLLSDIWTRGYVAADSLRIAEEALAKAVDYGWTRDEAALSLFAGWACFLIGRWPDADVHLTRAQNLIDATHGTIEGLYQIVLPYFRGNLAMGWGRLAEARAIFEAALGRARFHAPIWLNHDLARCLVMSGDLPAAREAMGRALAAQERWRCSICGCQAYGVAAEFYAADGDAARAERLAREAEATARRIGHPATLVRVRRARARIALEQGDPGRALDEAEAAVRVGRGLPLPQPFETAQSLMLLGEARVAAGDREGASATWQDALATFAGLGAAWHAARADEALAGVPR